MWEAHVINSLEARSGRLDRQQPPRPYTIYDEENFLKFFSPVHVLIHFICPSTFSCAFPRSKAPPSNRTHCHLASRPSGFIQLVTQSLKWQVRNIVLLRQALDQYVTFDIGSECQLQYMIIPVYWYGCPDRVWAHRLAPLRHPGKVSYQVACYTHPSSFFFNPLPIPWYTAASYSYSIPHLDFGRLHPLFSAPTWPARRPLAHAESPITSYNFTQFTLYFRYSFALTTDGTRPSLDT